MHLGIFSLMVRNVAMPEQAERWRGRQRTAHSDAARPDNASHRLESREASGAPPPIGLESVKKNQQVAASWNGAGGP